MGFASYLERLRELADETLAERPPAARSAPAARRSFSWTPHYRAAKEKPPVSSRIARAFEKLTPEERTLFQALQVSASEYCEADIGRFKFFFDKQNGPAARKRFEVANKNFRHDIRRMYLQILVLHLIERKKFSDVGSIYLLDRIIRAGAEMFDAPFRDEMKWVEDQLGSGDDVADEPAA